MQHYFYGRALGNLGNQMAVIAVISFQFPKKDFLMFYNIQTLCDTVCIFLLNLINVKGVIDVPVAMAPIFFFVLEHGVTRIFRKQVIYVIITSFATSSTHIYPIEGCYW